MQIGERNGRRTAALVSDMDIPLGYNIGNSLEVAEAVDTLRAAGPEDLTAVCLELAAGLLVLAGQGEHDECRQRAQRALQDGSAFEKWKQMVAAQGGDTAALENPGLLPQAKVTYQLLSPQAGYIAAMDTEQVGIAALVLGAGRETKEDSIDPAAGIRLLAKPGSRVEAGAPLALLMAASEEKIEAAKQRYISALTFSEEKPELPALLQARVTAGGVVYLGRQ